MKFEDYIEKYCSYIDIKLKKSTIYCTKNRIRTHILPYFKNMNIEDINAKTYLDWQEQTNNLNLSYNYKKQLHYTMVGFYSYLNLFYNVEKNIPKMVGPFTNNEIPKEMEYWTIEEFKKFIKCINSKDYVYKVFFIILFTTGIREGEALALTFNDLSDTVLNINKTLSKEFFNGDKLITTPKTKDSIRKIKLDNYTYKQINKLKQRYTKEYGYFNENFYILGGKKPICISTIKRKMINYCKLSKTKKIRIHDLRHSHATMLLLNNVPLEEVSRRLGHSNINITIKTYSHLTEEYEKKALSALNSIFR